VTVLMAGTTLPELGASSRKWPWHSDPPEVFRYAPWSLPAQVIDRAMKVGEHIFFDELGLVLTPSDMVCVRSAIGAALDVVDRGAGRIVTCFAASNTRNLAGETPTCACRSQHALDHRVYPVGTGVVDFYAIAALAQESMPESDEIDVGWGLPTRLIRESVHTGLRNAELRLLRNRETPSRELRCGLERALTAALRALDRAMEPVVDGDGQPIGKYACVMGEVRVYAVLPPVA
jgi:hypothetical protein